MVSIRELARRLRRDGIADLTHQRVSQIFQVDPTAPPLVPVGRSKAVSYELAAAFFKGRDVKQGQRTDLENKRKAEQDQAAADDKGATREE